ncbi:hypothetical protein MNBD_CHLOROFLEXI01-1204 [hydrothermal vent metagenome]|uniref:Uncharacterized protein n=1 Tax=hydrothermal vent metagenome TaxID=652676 RepID=A0A3B0UIX6_9ZZZZ
MFEIPPLNLYEGENTTMQNEKKGLIIIGAAGQQGQEYLGIMHHLKELVDLRAVVDVRTNELAKIQYLRQNSFLAENLKCHSREGGNPVE